MNFDHVAPVYRVLEQAVFGGALQRARIRWLGELPKCRRALVLGEGDGRFLVELIKAQPGLEIDCLEASEKMICRARRRLAAAPDGQRGVKFIHEDARRWVPSASYDLVVTHFFLDCFGERELDAIVGKIGGALTPGGVWLLADFAIPASGWGKWYGRSLIPIMYFFFRIAAGLRANRLIDPTAILVANGLECVKRDTFLGGVLKSEEWAQQLRGAHSF